MYDNKIEEEEKPFELDSEFILRLPAAPAASLRSAIRSEVKHWKNRLQIQIEPDMRHTTVQFDNWTLRAKIHDLPTLIESHKTLDRKVYYKVADVCQIMICENEDNDNCSDEDSSPKKLDRDGRDKRYLYPHGITACLKNVRKKRFRKTLRKKYTEMPSVEKEVKMLLKTDAEAINSRFEIVTIEDEKTNDKNEHKAGEDQNNEGNGFENVKLGKYEIFGEVSSSSGESADDDDDDDVDIGGSQETEQNLSDVIPRQVKEDPESDSRALVNDSTHNSTPVSQFESETAEQQLDQISEQNVSNKKIQLNAKLDELKDEITSIRAERRAEEGSILSIENSDLKQKVLANINHLKMKEYQKQEDYKEVMLVLQNS